MTTKTPPGRAGAAQRLRALRAGLEQRTTAAIARAGRLRDLMRTPRPRPAVKTPPQIEELRTTMAERHRRRRVFRGLALLALLAVLLLLLRECSCAPEPPPPLPELVCPDVPECVGPAKPGTPAKKWQGTTRKKQRDDLTVPSGAAPPWLAAWRLQVMARSVDLATCFNGVGKPGALRLTTTVTPRSGTLAETTLEPILGAAALTAVQEACVLKVLSAPRYRLGAEPSQDVAARVSLILEF